MQASSWREAVYMTVSSCLAVWTRAAEAQAGDVEIMMPIFLDRHDLRGLTAADIAEAHRKDLEVQERYGVRFLTYWFDEARGTGFCLIDAPDIQTAMRVHDEAHGHVAKDVIEVDLSAVEAFLGRVSEPASERRTPPTRDSILPCVPSCSRISSIRRA